MPFLESADVTDYRESPISYIFLTVARLSESGLKTSGFTPLLTMCTLSLNSCLIPDMEYAVILEAPELRWS